jgi:hypothetical protein
MITTFATIKKLKKSYKEHWTTRNSKLVGKLKHLEESQ